MSCAASPCKSPAALRQLVHELGHTAGAVAIGVARADKVDDEQITRYASWLAAGCHAGMSYLERHAQLRSDPALLLDGVRTVVCMAFSYGRPGTPCQIADYALGEDYHDVLRRRLKAMAADMQCAAGGRTRVTVDTAPLPERWWAARAGVGVIADNGLLVVPGVGSRVFLAEILWTIEVEPDKPLSGGCMHCGRCTQACPGAALGPDGHVDARRCLSYLSIEHRGDLPDGAPRLRQLYGCDVCQRVCPLNDYSVPIEATLPEFEPRPDVMAITPEQAASMQQSDFDRLFGGSAVRRAGLEGLLRNARDLLDS